MNFVWLTSGAFLLFFALLLSKKLEGRYLAPASFFFIVFFLHAYADGYSAMQNGVYFNDESTETIRAFSLVANVFLLCGYLAASPFFEKKYHYGFETKFLGSSSFYFIAAASLIVLLVLFFYMKSLGVYSSTRGAFQYQKGLYRYMVNMAIILYSFLPALMLSILFDEENSTKMKRWVVYFLVLLMLAYALSQYGRKMVFAILMTFAMIYHCRYQSFKIWQYLLFGAAFILVTVVSMLRAIGSGIFYLNYKDVQYYFREENFFDKFMRMVSEVVPGNQVFSNVIYYVDNGEPLRLGSTYLDSFLSLFVPNVLTGNFVYNTPAIWFKEKFAPDISGHGFGFSMMAEAYLNFSFFGVFVFLLVGFFVGVCSNVLRKTNNAISCLWAAMAIVGFSMGLREDSNVLFSYIFYFILPFLLTRLALRTLLIRR